MDQPTFSTRRLDHLGLVAGLCKHFDLAGQIDRLVPCEPEQKVSHGEVVVAMVLNALGFVSRPLYLFPEFFRNKPVDALIRDGLTADDFNDDRLGRTLDALFAHGVTELFAALAANILDAIGVVRNIVHLDTTSLSFHGAYEVDDNENPVPPSPEQADDRHPIHITYGFSKDKRSDLKQAVLSMVTVNQSTLPAWMEALDGNRSDKKSFPQTVSSFCDQLRDEPEPLFVMDSAGYSKDNLAHFGSHRFVCRVPHTLKAAQELLATDFSEDDWHEADDDHGYRVVDSDYGGVAQRWLLVFSRARAKRDLASTERKLSAAREAADKAANKLSRRRFTCEPDAREAVTELQRSLRFHRVEADIVKHERYRKRGRPKKGQQPDVIEFQVLVEVQDDEEAQRAALDTGGLYIIATNELDTDVVSHDRLLSVYKDQNTSVERGFRFLKDPLFFASALYLHKPERIMALLMIMTLSLLIYSVGERHVREQLELREETVPSQTGKPTATPTLRRIFQVFEGLDILEVRTGDHRTWQTLNFQPLHRKILDLFPEEVKNIYLDPGGRGM